MRQDLIERYLPLVRKAVDRIKLRLPTHVDADDLHSAGTLGLIGAVDRYDESKRDTFAGYASLRIRGAILDELRGMDTVPRRARARSRVLKAAVEVLEQRHQRAPTDAELRAHLGLTPAQLKERVAEAQAVFFVPLDKDADTEDGNGASLHELLADEADTTGRDSLQTTEMAQLLGRFIAELPERSRQVITLYYFGDLRMHQIAEVLGVTESRICQIHIETVAALRERLRRGHHIDVKSERPTWMRETHATPTAVAEEAPVTITPLPVVRLLRRRVIIVVHAG